jgi:hypothetical protein
MLESCWARAVAFVALSNHYGEKIYFYRAIVVAVGVIKLERIRK